MNTPKFETLFQPGKIGNMETKNRFVMSPMITEYATKDGFITDRMIKYYEERAKGGVGLIIVEASYVQWPLGKGFSGQIALHDDKYIAGLKKLAEAIKQNGAHASIQIHHAGGSGKSKIIGGQQPVAPSAVSFYGYEPSRAITVEEIKETVGCFVDAAIRCEKAGFDSIMIHACHHYLLANFLSPAWNQRTDEYGGSIRNRARFVLEVLKGIKEAVNVPVMCRINTTEMGAKELFGVEKEFSIEDAVETAKLLEKNGIDAIHCTLRGYGGKEVVHMMPLNPGEMLPLIEQIKKAVKVPVMGVGRLSPETAEKALRDGKMDFAAIGRGLLVDPYFPKKVSDGDLTEIAPCICCFNCIQVSAYGYQPGLRCSVNARCGREGDYPSPMEKVKNAKRVLVIGGGPGGMEAARVSALRGHDVTLMEKSDELGGQLLYADKAPSKHNIGLLSEYLSRQVRNLGIKIELGKEATPEIVADYDPDAVIIATGAEPLTPSIEDVDKPNVIQALDVLSGGTVGQRVVVVGGDMVGCETAEILADQGKNVTVCEMTPELLTKMAVQLRRPVIARMKEKGIQYNLDTKVRKVLDEGVSFVDGDGEEGFIEAETVVLACGSRPVNDLVARLEGQVPEIHCVGDAKEPRQIVYAVHEAFEAAYKL